MNSNFQLPLDDFPVDHHRADEVLKFLNAQSFLKLSENQRSRQVDAIGTLKIVFLSMEAKVSMAG